jgi:hypothetical protein
MKKAAIVLFVSALLVVNVIGTPLVFKTTKVIDSPESLAELFTLDTSKFNRLRIHIASTAVKYDLVIQGIEGDEVLFLQPISLSMADAFRFNTIFETPPAKTRISIVGKGTFKVFVWGQ